jgi:ATP-binding cassette, subfamily C, bacterial
LHSSQPSFRREITDFVRDFVQVVGWRAPATVGLMITLGALDGIGLLLLVPLLGAAGLAGETVTPFIGAWLPSGLGLEAIVLTYLGVVLAYVGLKLAAGRLNAALAERYAVAVRATTHERLTWMSWRRLLDYKSSEVAHALTTNVDAVARGALALLQSSTSVVLLSAQLAVALLLSTKLTLFAVCAIAIVAFGTRRLYRKVLSDATAVVAAGKQLHHGAEDFVRRLRHVRAFDKEAQTHREFALEVGTYARGIRDIQWTMGTTQSVTEASAVLIVGLSFYFGLRVLEVPLAALVAFGVVLARLLPRVMALQREAQVVASALPARRALATLTEPERAPVAKRAARTDPMAVVSWEDLSFRVGSLAWSIDRLQLERGKLTALVGASGAGKSVLCDVLAWLLTPDRARCTVNGVELPPGTTVARSVRLGYLAQHCRPWQATVGEALRWAAPEATAEECWAALDQAGLRERLQTYGGLGTPLGDAALWLSGGEVHRLALAQVLMRKPQVLILDEPSAALDADTEARIVETIRALASDLPVLVITHREAVAAAASRVLAIVERADGTRSIEVRPGGA